MKAILFADRSNPWFHAHDFFHVYSDYVMERLAELPGLQLEPGILYWDQLQGAPDRCRDVQVLLSNWGMPSLSVDEIERYFPSLRAVFYAGSTVRQFCQPFFERGIRLFSAGEANAVPASEYALAQILLAGKRVLPSMRMYRDPDSYERARSLVTQKAGNYQAKVGLIGCGRVGSRVAALLRPFNLQVMAADPYLPPQRAQQLGVALVELDEIFQSCDVISCHLPDSPAVNDLLTYELFSQMMPGATFINCAQGNSVDEPGLVRALQEDPTRTAVLDSAKREPMDRDDPLMNLENVFVSPHIAGSFGGEVERMGETLVEACAQFLSGAPSPHEATAETRFWIG